MRPIVGGMLREQRRRSNGYQGHSSRRDRRSRNEHVRPYRPAGRRFNEDFALNYVFRRRWGTNWYTLFVKAIRFCTSNLSRCSRSHRSFVPFPGCTKRTFTYRNKNIRQYFNFLWGPIRQCTSTQFCLSSFAYPCLFQKSVSVVAFAGCIHAFKASVGRTTSVL